MICLGMLSINDGLIGELYTLSIDLSLVIQFRVLAFKILFQKLESGSNVVILDFPKCFYCVAEFSKNLFVKNLQPLVEETAMVTQCQENRDNREHLPFGED